WHFERSRPQTGVRQFPPWLRFPGFNRPRPVRVAVGLLDVLPALETRVRLQGISFGNPDAWLTRNCVLASCYGDEWSALQWRSFGESHFWNFRRFTCQREIFSSLEVRVT